MSDGFPDGLWDENVYNTFEWQFSPPETTGTSIAAVEADTKISVDDVFVEVDIVDIQTSVISAIEQPDFKFGVWEEFSWDRREWQFSPP